jgi:hypothetical protein
MSPRSALHFNWGLVGAAGEGDLYVNRPQATHSSEKLINTTLRQALALAAR